MDIQIEFPFRSSTIFVAVFNIEVYQVLKVLDIVLYEGNVLLSVILIAWYWWIMSLFFEIVMVGGADDF